MKLRGFVVKTLNVPLESIEYRIFEIYGSFLLALGWTWVISLDEIKSRLFRVSATFIVRYNCWLSHEWVKIWLSSFYLTWHNWLLHENKSSFNLRRHNWLLHETVLVLLPEQVGTPWTGGGLLQSRVWVWVPPPQVALQLDQLPQADHPGTGREEILKMIFKLLQNTKGRN